MTTKNDTPAFWFHAKKWWHLMLRNILCNQQKFRFFFTSKFFLAFVWAPMFFRDFRLFFLAFIQTPDFFSTSIGLSNHLTTTPMENPLAKLDDHISWKFPANFLDILGFEQVFSIGKMQIYKLVSLVSFWRTFPFQL